jgi:hypothetical protein
LWLWHEPQDIAMNTKRVHGFWDDTYGSLYSLMEMWVSE